MIRKNHIQVRKTARYFTIGEINDETEEVWIVCHGYGQLAEYFIRRFEGLSNDKTFILAPEALNRFYQEGFNGRVGATWMTKEDRESEIADYVEYFENLKATVLADVDFNKVKLYVLGFSQGVAAVCRWVVFKNIPFYKLILWAGVFPPDLNTDFTFSVHSLKEKEVVIVYGDKDPLLKEENIKELELFRNIKPDLKIVRFEGGHEIKENLLLTLRG